MFGANLMGSYMGEVGVGENFRKTPTVICGI